MTKPKYNVTSFDHFPPFVQKMAEKALSTTPSAKSRVDELERSSRSQLLSLADEFLSDDGSHAADCLKDIVSFLCAMTELCHLIVMLSHLVSPEVRGESSSTTRNEHSDDSPPDQGNPTNGSDTSFSSKWIAAAEGMGSAAVSLPFSLLEDALDTLPISKCKVLWIECLERQSHLLCGDVLFSPGSKLTMLRISNKILTKKLLRERDSEFAGRVLIFLANKFQLSERSGLNIQGKFNLENVTNFEDEKTFEEVKKQSSAVQLASLPSVSEDIVDTVKDGITFVDDDDADKDRVVDYNLYRTFWGIQEFLCNPNSITSNSSSDANNFDNFIRITKVVLTAFESRPFPAVTAKQARLRWLARKRQRVGDDKESSEKPNASEQSDISNHLHDEAIIMVEEHVESKGNDEHEETNNAGKGDNVVRHQKYLTSSQLLRLQLRDPSLRCHFLTQILIVFSYLIHSKELDARKREQLVILKRRVEDCLALIPPSGLEQVQLLLHLFDKSESFWRQWKEDKCKTFEKYGAFVLPPVSNKSSGKRKQGASAQGATGDGQNVYEELRWRGDLNSLPHDTAQLWHNKQDFFVEYVEACDPDNGIEAEYHPKNDPLFCWRALRILSADNLDLFGLVDTKTGDFEKVVRVVWEKEMGISIPGGESSSINEDTMSDDAVQQDLDIRGSIEEGSDIKVSKNENEVDHGVDMIVADIFDDKPDIPETNSAENAADEIFDECLDDSQNNEKEVHDSMLSDTKGNDDDDDIYGDINEYPGGYGEEVEEGEEKVVEKGKVVEKEVVVEKEKVAEKEKIVEKVILVQEEKDRHSKERPRHSEGSLASKRDTSKRSDGKRNESSMESRRHDVRHLSSSAGRSTSSRVGGRGSGRDHHETGGGRDHQRDNYGSRRPQESNAYNNSSGGGTNRPGRARSQGGGRR